MMNPRQRFVDVFRTDSMDMNALTGKAYTKCFDRLSGRAQRVQPALLMSGLHIMSSGELSENKHYIFHDYIVQNFLKAS
jgi:hypothetical protein